MKFFTPELLTRYTSDDPAVAGAADAEWETANDRYGQLLQELEPELPANIREFNSLLLHDALVQSLARENGRLIMILKKDIPPREIVILRYELVDEPVLMPFEKNPRDWQKPTHFNFDEFDREQTIYTQCIVFSNGWELRLRFRDVHVTIAEPWIPTNGFTPETITASPGILQTG
jgi:hypothetical protein